MSVFRFENIHQSVKEIYCHIVLNIKSIQLLLENT